MRTGTVGQTDDQYVDGTRYDPAKAPEAGRKSDPKTGGGYVDNVSDEVPGIIVAPFTGDRGDIPTTAVWKDGVWAHLKKSYAFGVAVFDNAQVRHAYSTSVLKLAFE